MKRTTLLVAVAVAVVTAALTAQAGAVPGPIAQQETPTESPTPSPEETPTNETPTNETPTEDGPLTPENETPEDETPEDETPTEDGVVPTDNETTEPAQSLTFEDQETNGTTVTVSNVTLTQPGYVAIHDETLEFSATDSVIGVSDYLPAGEYNNVTITLFDVPGANYTAEGAQTTAPAVNETGNETANDTANETANDTEPSLQGAAELTAMLHVETDAERMMGANETPTPAEETPETPTPESDNQTMDVEDPMFEFVESGSLLDPPVLVNDTPITDNATVTVVEDTDENETATPTEDGTATPTENETATPTEDGTATTTENETATPTEGTETATGTP
ncbi:hypothetical protein EGH22_09485 [Halomicroarcula sp. F28]|uniref:DUF7282 domain-containing protein n=1 Tax=Haloarcula salinisoli TaxID=2487746 RepID=UPI001C73914C|nr:hypothetical protein [Halomicroarcula salinisoli]MBX0286558.1 hypothetical protein [Halomicroarcula salinisoli]